MLDIELAQVKTFRKVGPEMKAASGYFEGGSHILTALPKEIYL